MLSINALKSVREREEKLRGEIHHVHPGAWPVDVSPHPASRPHFSLSFDKSQSPSAQPPHIHLYKHKHRHHNGRNDIIALPKVTDSRIQGRIQETWKGGGEALSGAPMWKRS